MYLHLLGVVNVIKTGPNRISLRSETNLALAIKVPENIEITSLLSTEQ